MSAVDARSPRRIDGWEKVTGAATYAIDVELPNTAFGAIVPPSAPMPASPRSTSKRPQESMESSP